MRQYDVFADDAQLAPNSRSPMDAQSIVDGLEPIKIDHQGGYSAGAPFVISVNASASVSVSNRRLGAVQSAYQSGQDAKFTVDSRCSVTSDPTLLKPRKSSSGIWRC
jgi:hypothetical protein